VKLHDKRVRDLLHDVAFCQRVPDLVVLDHVRLSNRLHRVDFACVCVCVCVYLVRAH